MKSMALFRLMLCASFLIAIYTNNNLNGAITDLNSYPLSNSNNLTELIRSIHMGEKVSLDFI